MPRNVRNFWIEADIDGQATRISGGPQAKDGGLDLTVKMRHNGDVVDVLDIIGRVMADGTLRLRIRPYNHVKGLPAPEDIVIETQR